MQHKRGGLLLARMTWTLLGLLLFVVGGQGSGWLPRGIPLLVLGLWAAGVALLASGERARRILDTGREASRRTDVAIAAIVVGALWILLIDLVGLYGGLAMLTALALAGLAIASTGRTDRVAGALLNAALSGTSLMLVAAAVEGALRIPALAERLGTPAERRAWDERGYDRLWERNAFGFRSRHETVARLPNSLRILAIGDSFTWGDKVASSDDTWPAALERLLASELPDRTVEVINMGRNGFTTANEAELLRRVGWQFAPDVIIVQAFRNDPLPSGPNYQRAGTEHLTPPRTLVPVLFRQGRIRYSALLYLMERQYSTVRNYAPVDPSLALYEDGIPGWEQMKAALEEIGSSARQRGVPLYLVLFPQLYPGTWTLQTHRDSVIHQKIITAAQRAGMRVVDLTGVLGDGVRDARSWWARPYDPHPNEQALELSARTLRDVLVADGIGERTVAAH